MANAGAHPKLMTIGEGGSALAFAALAMFSIIVAAGAFTPEFAFHAYLFAAASIAAVFAIVNRYYERPDEATALIVDGKPNYNMGPVKFASIAAVVWGIAGFTVGLVIAHHTIEGIRRT
jgi:cytochrome c oxidase cbb3-type subunit 1